MHNINTTLIKLSIEIIIKICIYIYSQLMFCCIFGIVIFIDFYNFVCIYFFKGFEHPLRSLAPRPVFTYCFTFICRIVYMANTKVQLVCPLLDVHHHGL